MKHIYETSEMLATRRDPDRRKVLVLFLTSLIYILNLTLVLLALEDHGCQQLRNWIIVILVCFTYFFLLLCHQTFSPQEDEHKRYTALMIIFTLIWMIIGAVWLTSTHCRNDIFAYVLSVILLASSPVALPIVAYVLYLLLLCFSGVLRFLYTDCRQSLGYPRPHIPPAPPAPHIPPAPAIEQPLLSQVFEADDTCTICLDPFLDGEMIQRLPCTHYFHAACVGKWIKTKKTCPLCRLVVN